MIRRVLLEHFGSGLKKVWPWMKWPFSKQMAASLGEFSQSAPTERFELNEVPFKSRHFSPLEWPRTADQMWLV